MSENIEEIINKLVKIVSHDDRILIGKLKCIDDNCTLFLSEVVEVFDKEGDYYVPNELYENNNENTFGFDSDKNYYQIYSPSIIPKAQIKKIYIVR